MIMRKQTDINHKDFRVTRAFLSLSLRDLWFDIASALLVGGIGGYFVGEHISIASKLSLTGDLLIIMGSLLGVIFVSFVLTIELFTDQYLLLLSSTENGVISFLRPFIVSITLQVWSVIIIIIYKALGPVVSSSIQNDLWAVICFFFFLSLFDIVSVGKAILAHGVTRAAEISIRTLEDEYNTKG